MRPARVQYPHRAQKASPKYFHLAIKAKEEDVRPQKQFASQYLRFHIVTVTYNARPYQEDFRT